MANYVFGIDVGGTSVKCGLFQTDGTLLEKWEIPTRTENGGSEILPDIAKSVKAKMGEKGIAADDVAGVGIDVPGPVNDKGELSIAVNLNWGYKNIDGAMALMDNYGRLVYDLETLIAQGLSAAIYTQTTDVEGEVNGLITYDRKVTKIPEGLLHLMHNRLYEITPAKAVTLIADGQNGSKNTRLVSLNGQELKMTSLPFDCPPRSTVVSEATFKVDKDFNHLSLWLNGVEVFAQEAKQTRQYNQYNISDYSRYLRKGSNLLKIEVKDSKKMRFDYGLRAY